MVRLQISRPQACALDSVGLRWSLRSSILNNTVGDLETGGHVTIF